MSAETLPLAGPRRATTAFIFVTIILDMLAFGMLAPVLPTLILEFEGGDRTATAHENGMLAFVWAGMQFLAMPVIGGLSDRFGRRAVILISTFGLAVSFLVTALAPSIRWLYLARIISGITSANFATANAYIADVTPPEGRAKAFGLLGAAFGVGFIIGPALGGILGGKLVIGNQLIFAGNAHLPFFVAAALSLLNTAYGLFVLPESLAPERRRAFAWRQANPLGAIRFLTRRSDLTALTIVTVLTFFVHTIYPSLFTLYVISIFGWDASGAGAGLVLVGVISVIQGAVLVQPVIKMMGERYAIMLGLVAWAASLTVFGLAPNGYVMLSGLLFGLLNAATQPALTSIMTRSVGPDEQGELQGSLGALRGMCDMVGPLMFSSVLFAAGMRPEIGLPGLPWLVAALLMATALAIVWPATRAITALRPSREAI